MESCVRGYHAYKDIWETSVGEELPCQRVIGNRADPFAVAVIKSGQTVGHIPRAGWKISWVENFGGGNFRDFSKVTKITKISTPPKISRYTVYVYI